MTLIQLKLEVEWNKLITLKDINCFNLEYETVLYNNALGRWGQQQQQQLNSKHYIKNKCH